MEPPHGLRHTHRGPLPARGIKITLTRDGEIVAHAITGGTGTFGLKVRPGKYLVSASIGPPTVTPGRVCETRTVSVVRKQGIRLRFFCLLR